MTLKKSDFRKGNIIPIYHDHKSCKNFRGVARLVSQQYPNGYDETSIFFIKDVIDKQYPKYRVGGSVYTENGIAEITKVGINQLKVSLNGEQIVYEKPFKFIDAFDIGDSIRTEHDNYYKTLVVIDDYKTYCAVVTQKTYDESEGNYQNLIQTATKLKKPFEYVRDDSEIQSPTYKEERWLVELLVNPFISSLKEGDPVYYRDRGVFQFCFKNNKPCVYKINSKNVFESEMIECTPQDLYVLSPNMAKTHIWVSYYYSRSNIILKNKEKQKEDVILDFWENNLDIED